MAARVPPRAPDFDVPGRALPARHLRRRSTTIPDIDDAIRGTIARRNSRRKRS